jgi:hypothetical protein
MEKDTLLKKNPSLCLGVVLIVLWALGFTGLATSLGSLEFVGIPLVTWTMIVIGVFSVIASIIIIPIQSRWEQSWWTEPRNRQGD